MSLRIENNSMSLEVDGRVVATARFSEHAAADGQGAWERLRPPAPTLLMLLVRTASRAVRPHP
jgi:hypothetical protein